MVIYSHNVPTNYHVIHCEIKLNIYMSVYFLSLIRLAAASFSSSSLSSFSSYPLAQTQ